MAALLFVSIMPLDEEGLPKLKLSYIRAPLVFGNPLLLCMGLEIEV